MLVMGVEIPDAEISAMRGPDEERMREANAKTARQRYDRAYYAAHRDEIVVKRRRRYREDAAYREAQSEYWRREDVKERRNRRVRERYRTDPEYRERRKAQQRARYAAKKANATKL